MAAKRDNRRGLFDALKKEIAPLYFLHGADSYMLSTAIDAVMEAALPAGRNDFNFARFRGAEATAEAILAEAETLPFLTDRRMVIVDAVESLPAAHRDGLIPYLENPAPTTVLVLVSLTVNKKLDRRQKFSKTLFKQAQVFEFKEFRDYEIPDVLRRNARKKGFDLDADASSYLVEAVGTELGPLMGALDKIALYLGAEATTATLEDARAVVSDTRVKSVFDLTDALGARAVEPALKTLDRMLHAGESAIGINVMIARHFRIVAKLQDRGVARLGQKDKQAAAGVSPFFLKTYEQHARRFSVGEVADIRRNLVITDLALKSSRLSSRVVMERLVFDVCSRGGAA